MAFVGMNPDVVKAQGKVLETQADKIKSISGRIDGLVADLNKAWNGPDSQRFIKSWNSEYKAQLTQASKVLRTKGQAAISQAKQQTATSA